MNSSKIIGFGVLVFITVAFVIVKQNIPSILTPTKIISNLKNDNTVAEEKSNTDVGVSEAPNGQEEENAIDRLTKAFEKKLALPSVRKLEKFPEYCNQTKSRGNSCNGVCKRLKIDTDLRTRIKQVFEPPQLQLPQKYKDVIAHMSSQVKGHYDVIIATGVSDNHFAESQGMVKNIHEKVFPLLKNSTFLYYNLGLSSSNKAKLVKHCRCQVIDFPFDKFPGFFKNLLCYTWKPMIIKAHIKQSNMLIWADSSVRFDKGDEIFRQLVAETKLRGLRFAGGVDNDVASRTMPTTFHYFGEEACSFIGLGEFQGGIGFYANEYLVERLFLEPWAACAVDQKCMCPTPFPELSAARSIQMMKKWKQGKGSITYGMAHRFDQSALNILVMKLYRERYLDTFLQKDYFTVRRGHIVKYFT